MAELQIESRTGSETDALRYFADFLESNGHQLISINFDQHNGDGYPVLHSLVYEPDCHEPYGAFSKAATSAERDDPNPDADPLRAATQVIHASLGYAAGNGGRAQAIAENLQDAGLLVSAGGPAAESPSVSPTTKSESRKTPAPGDAGGPLGMNCANGGCPSCHFLQCTCGCHRDAEADPIRYPDFNVLTPSGSDAAADTRIVTPDPRQATRPDQFGGDAYLVNGVPTRCTCDRRDRWQHECPVHGKASADVVAATKGTVETIPPDQLQAAIDLMQCQPCREGRCAIHVNEPPPGTWEDAMAGMARVSRKVEHTDRTGWGDGEWLAEARDIYFGEDGSVSAMLNGHVAAMFREIDRLEATPSAEQEARAAFRWLSTVDPEDDPAFLCENVPGDCGSCFACQLAGFLIDYRERRNRQASAGSSASSQGVADG